VDGRRRLFGAFLAGTVARNLIEPNTPWDPPDGENVARFGPKQRVTSVGGGRTAPADEVNGSDVVTIRERLGHANAARRSEGTDEE
jgi:hypothetical protein